MEPEHIIDETATIKGADIEKVYDDCVSWLKKKRYRMTQNHKPRFIQANYVTTFSTSPEDWDKNITINLKQTEAEIEIHLLIDAPHKQGRTRDRRANAYWRFVVEKLWKFIGVEISRELLVSIYPQTILVFILDDLKYGLCMMFFVFSFPFFYAILLDILMSTPLNISYILGIFLMILTLIIWIGGSQYLQVRKLLGDLYPSR
jgi:hypothetical protein